MRLKQELADARRRFDLLNFYGKFEQIVIFILTVLIAVFVIFAVGISRSKYCRASRRAH